MNKLIKYFSEIVFIVLFICISVLSFSLLFLNIEWIASGMIVSTTLFSVSLIGAYLAFIRLIRLVTTYKNKQNEKNQIYN